MSGVQGKLSGRVMNMKFMRFAKDDSESETGTRESSPSIKEDSVGTSRSSNNNNSSGSGFHDSSEWFATSANKQNLDKNKKNKRKVFVRAKKGPVRAVIADNVSLTHLQMQKGNNVRTTNDKIQNSTGNIGRRKFNEISKKRKVENDSTEDTDDYELDRVFKESIKRRKTSDSNKKK
ncbi:similar to Saccharomyces cerevisiae YNR024W MPP6 Nuclear exosome-associated RNA binding protein [Maudiozyma saulgeensis]|uniref:Similar to Saccharomyces cerevisiae YNR024W MPP6 Nuclear exosome-associated RNA binding protein n=1 Tax=Maudiozyma saulgeensis TaxID=1789683 RepID=A0A1X7R7Z7_9SACH|nr:similar to Saccharomyces cerevisiae YNR024W MPP6 Nuclear exosome-associated RNA binding protein [Kazachstania saulgeensis]